MLELMKAAVDAALNRPLRESIGLLVAPGSVLVDGIEKRNQSRPLAPAQPAGADLRDQHVHSRLGFIHFEASDPMTSSAISESYVYSDEVAGASDTVVNANEREQTRFVNRLVEEAERQKRLVGPREQMHPNDGALPAHASLFILHGSRGIGKSYFLSHVFATHSSFLKKRKVIWVKVDLSRQIEDADVFPVADKVATKLTRNLFAHCNSKLSDEIRQIRKVEGFDVYDALRTKIMTKIRDDGERAALIKALERVNYLYSEASHTEPFTRTSVEGFIRNAAIDVALSAGYSIIVVLDGLDRLEATPHAERQFEKLLQQVQDLSAAARLGYCIVVVSRTESRARLLEANPQLRERAQHNSYRVGRASLRPVLEKRVALIRAEVDRKFAPAPGPDVPLEYNEWHERFEGFFQKLLEEGDQIETLLPGANLREQMQFVQLRYYESILAHKRTYHITEQLVLVGYEYPPRHFAYSKLADETLKRTPFDAIRYDNHFFPSVFAFPTTEQAHSGKVSHLMMGIRILQLAQASSKKYGSGQDGRIAVEDLLCMLGVLGYDKWLGLALIEEYIEFDLLGAAGGVMDFSSRNANFLVYALPKCNAMLKVLLCEVAYLGLALMRAPLPRDFFGDLPFVLTAGARSSGRQRLRMKARNAIGACRLMRELNELEAQVMADRKHVALERRPELQAIVDLAIEQGAFTFHTTAIESVRKQVTRMTRGDQVPAHELAELAKELKTWSDRWS